MSVDLLLLGALPISQLLIHPPPPPEKIVIQGKEESLKHEESPI
jgi:hypothetical protein